MRLMTQLLRDRAWSVLTGKYAQLNDFESREEFDDAFSVLAEVRGDGSNAYVCRKASDIAFGPENIVLVNIEDEGDFHRVIAPAIRFEG